MSHLVAKNRIESTKPRSGSISDTSKLDSALASLKLAPTSASKGSDGSSEQELSGVILKRIPLVEADFNTNTTIPSYQYHLENKRDYDVRVVMVFAGTNTKVSPASSTFSQPDPISVEGIIAKGKSTPFALLDAADKSKDFTFEANVKIYPVHEDIRETELEGVKLFTTITYSGVMATMIFEAQNNKDFDVEVEVNLSGEISEKSSSLPFKKAVPVGKRETLGNIKSDKEIETSWKWVAISADTPNPQKKEIVTSELKGVTLKQTLTPGNPTTVEFEVSNTRERRVKVEIDLVGEGEVDFKGQARPLTGLVQPSATTFIGAVTIKGDSEVNWKFKEETD